MIQRVEDFAYTILVEVFNAKDTANFAIQAILENNFYDMGPKCKRIKNPDDWTPKIIQEKAALIDRVLCIS
jgi:fructose-bisphosphate aldolase class II